ncbi:MAG: glycosyltransferase [Roseiflexaceae bacterium]|nr:glycosyltransferase [Roseiflexaceae bacterium]
MKILAILTFYHPHWTGLTAHATAVAEGLVARGHQVTVLTTRYSHELARDEMVKGVRVVRLQPAGRVTRTLVSPAFPWAAAKLIAEHDVVQIHTPLSEAPLVAALCRALGRPLLMTHHGDLVMPAGAINKLVERVAFPLLSYTGKSASAATSYSEDYADSSKLLQTFREKLSFIYPPVELPAPTDAAVAWRRELGLEGVPVIGIAGRWVEEKGFDYLLEAMPLVRNHLPGAHLIYAGERQVVYENFYERCLPQIEAQSGHITFLGLIRDPQKMANFYAMCDLFALPSRSDMMALVQVEAMLAGTPVVASDIPGARVVVRDTGYGKLVPPRDPQALAATILEVLQHPAHYLPTVAGVRRVFNTEQTMRSYEQLMERIIATAAGTSRRASSAQRGARAALQALSTGAALQAVTTPALSPVQRTHGGLGPDDHAKLDTLLRNEADMAFARRARTLLDYLDLKDGEKVLDCGCGMGVYIMMMNRLRDLHIFGVDGDVARLEWAEREGVEARLSSVDIQQLPFADNTFDKVLMSEVLEHIADDRQAMREVFRVLKPGGILALSVPHANYPLQWDPINKTLEALDITPIRKPGLVTGLWSNHWRLYRPEELYSVISAAGFAIEALEEQTHYSFPFIHFIVYSIGKPLIERNLLPKGLRDSADRFRGEQNSGSMFNPINLGVKVFRHFDAKNDRLQGDEQTFVNLVAKARKPQP